MAKDFTELWGRKFEIVKNGLSEDQVVSYVNELNAEHEKLSQRQEHLVSLTKLAEKTVTEAEKLSEEIKREAAEEAKSEAAKLVAEAETRAEQSAEEKRSEIIASATKEAESIKTNAEREAEQIVERQKKKIYPELKSMAQVVYDQLLSDLQNLNKQVAAMGEEFERKLAKFAEETGTPTEARVSVPPEDSSAPHPSSGDDVESISDTLDQLRHLIEDGEEQLRATTSGEPEATDQAGEAEETPVSGETQTPPSYKEKVELEFPSPANILQILEIDKHLETLSGIEATEIIPIAGKPVITIYLREQMQLVDILSELPEVSQVKETEGEPATGSDGNQDGEKTRKFQITLTGNSETGKEKDKEKDKDKEKEKEKVKD